MLVRINRSNELHRQSPKSYSCSIGLGIEPKSATASLYSKEREKSKEYYTSNGERLSFLLLYGTLT